MSVEFYVNELNLGANRTCEVTATTFLFYSLRIFARPNAEGEIVRSSSRVKWSEEESPAGNYQAITVPRWPIPRPLPRQGRNPHQAANYKFSYCERARLQIKRKDVIASDVSVAQNPKQSSTLLEDNSAFRFTNTGDPRGSVAAVEHEVELQVSSQRRGPVTLLRTQDYSSRRDEDKTI